MPTRLAGRKALLHDLDVAPGIGERRRHARSAVTWVGWLERASGDMIECGVVDLSVGGAKVVLETPLAAGERVVFKSPRFEGIAARIAWCEDGVVGLQFLDGAERVMRLLGGKDGEALAPARPAQRPT
jgi:hypothetical protein